MDFGSFDWISLLGMVFSAVGGGGLTGLWMSRSAKERERSEAGNVTADLLDKHIDTIRELEQDNKLKNELIVDLRGEAATKGIYMCRHQGCGMREPRFGRGKAYYEQHKDDPGFGADFTSADELFEAYRNKRKLITYEDNGTDTGTDIQG